MAAPNCRICAAPGTYFCTWCESSFFCDRHICAHLGKDLEQEKRVKETEPMFPPALKAILIAVAVIIILCLIWSSHGDGSVMN